MSKFKDTLRIIEEGLLKPMSSTDIKQVDTEAVKEAIDKFISRSTKNPDGSIDIDGDVYLNNLKLKKLPLKFNKINGNFDCSYNALTSLEGAPTEVIGDFICSENKLSSLIGGPTQVKGTYSCSFNELTSLEGAPNKISRSFYCSRNQLTSLEGAPSKVNNDFVCNYNRQLSTLIGAPSYVGKDFYCFDGKVKFTQEQVRAVCDVKGDIIV